ncbi:hypothetical protein ZIOFF_030621 [Zingiber officinale]|uniref:GATA-type domain-containing protein n=2 Tax=Zingiber officinale TaxID=94328 RepID=A0A8J5L532_ZINOF|nr:hypothetical protein ZIOFF_030621 [Zingiber officinale]
MEGVGGVVCLQGGEEMEDGVGHLFDHIEDLLDFPGDEDGFGMVPEPILLPSLPVRGADEVLGGEGGKKADGEFSVEEGELNPCDELDIEQLEWMSKFLEDSDSFSIGLTAAGGGGGDAAEKSVGERCCFRTSSPVSVLEANTNGGGGVSSDSSITTSSSSSSSTPACYFLGGKKEEKAVPLPRLSPPEPPAVPAVPGRARSKRARPAIFSPQILVVIPSLPPPADAVNAATSDPESFGESSSPAPPPPLKKKSKKKKMNPYADESDSPPPVRKCAHCQIQKTPQWRAGPMGPKTLCNACGVRYKSGRLFPEYRPAASPTFVPSVHSNSHKKVVEMRIKANQNAAEVDGCDLLDYIRRRRD